jgi:hypothetical protein
MVAADPCAELQQLEQQYESALRTWVRYQFPLHKEGPAWRFGQLQLKQKALAAKNAANDRLLDHKLNCPLCAAKPNP